MQQILDTLLDADNFCEGSAFTCRPVLGSLGSPVHVAELRRGQEGFQTTLQTRLCVDETTSIKIAADLDIVEYAVDQSIIANLVLRQMCFAEIGQIYQQDPWMEVVMWKASPLALAWPTITLMPRETSRPCVSVVCLFAMSEENTMILPRIARYSQSPFRALRIAGVCRCRQQVSKKCRILGAAPQITHRTHACSRTCGK